MLIGFQVTIENVGYTFLRHSVVTLYADLADVHHEIQES